MCFIEKKCIRTYVIPTLCYDMYTNKLCKYQNPFTSPSVKPTAQKTRHLLLLCVALMERRTPVSATCGCLLASTKRTWWWMLWDPAFYQVRQSSSITRYILLSLLAGHLSIEDRCSNLI